MLSLPPYFFKQNLAGFTRGNQVIRLQSAEVAVVIISLHVQAKDRKQSSGLHKHKTEPRYVYIRLEMYSSTVTPPPPYAHFPSTNYTNIKR